MILSFSFVLALACLAMVAGPLLPVFFGLFVPYAAFLVFLVGFVWRLINWGRTPVPFRVPTVGGQQKSLDFIKPSSLDAPYSHWAALARVLLEAFAFRSLLRNSGAELSVDGRLLYRTLPGLWFFALLFHYSLLLVFLRHFRIFLENPPALTGALENLDAFLEVGRPRFYLSAASLALALFFLLLRRVLNGRLRYISLPGDYSPLFLLIGIVVSGLFLRYCAQSDYVQTKAFVAGIFSLRPQNPAGLHPAFFLHLFFVSILLASFPFSKLMHMGGIFFSPARNLPNNSRAAHHENPWKGPLEFRGYADYENEFRAVMREAGLPLEIDPDQTSEAKE
ncbi:MAG: sulfate reduction electron transfer complex DsrMKJOP subunit DsrM [Desulfovibrio sp.]|nr:sulfate reduction electron transfer complex DsrMKJOP subunit DsrM [Desulfovibrio sp.]